MGYSAADITRSAPILHPFYSSITGKYGYLDEDGVVIINPNFDFASDFANNLARVRVGELFGYIDSSGAFVIIPRFKTAGTFLDGLALASEEGVYENPDGSKGGRYGYIDTAGQFVIPSRLQFTPDMLRSDVSYDLGKGPFFSEGVAPFIELSKWGFITKTGEVVIEPKYDEVEPFSEGFAVVRIGSSWKTKSYHIDHSGKFLNAWAAGWLGSFREGLATFTSGNRSDYIRRDGKLARLPKFWRREDFHEELAAATLERDPLKAKVGFINHSGVFVITPTFDSAGPFRNGLAKVTTKEHFRIGYIDKSGRFQIPPIYSWGGDFKGNVAYVGVKSWYNDKCPADCCIQLQAIVRNDGKIIYAWSEIAKDDYSLGEDCSLQTEGGAFMFAGPQLFDVTFSSTPSGANVFAVPYAVYDFNKGIEDSLAQLRPFAILNGTTPVPVRLFAQKYRIVFRKDDKQTSVDFDLFANGAKVDVTFP
jgi:hypothetical protein